MKLKIAVPKGRMYDNVAKLMEEAGFKMSFTNGRSYRPVTTDPDIEIKVLKPQNIAKLVELGKHDVGFTGYDWVIETGADVEEVIDLKTDPVKVVAAVPKELKKTNLKSRKLIVASEYENITKNFLDKAGYDYIYLRTYGATEVFPPEDADMIVDNSATGATLEQNNLVIVEEILQSSTRMIANKAALKDQWKKEKISEIRMLFESVLNAHERVMLEMNVSAENFDSLVRILPCMRSPTVAQLADGAYAVKVAVKKSEVSQLIPKIKKMGATDILEMEFKKVII
jgi:ATP phosphoribosyltransferase